MSKAGRWAGLAKWVAASAVLISLAPIAAAQSKQCLDINLEANIRIAGCTGMIEGALKLVPHDSDTLILRGNAYDAIGEKAKAVADYSEAIRLNPAEAVAFVNRASVFQGQGQKDKAIADYRAALRIDPELDAAKAGSCGARAEMRFR